jgi:peptidylprolyl isomerase/peptidyl-prolyl cis-trans isomerase B (cyclophilin B)
MIWFVVLLVVFAQIGSVPVRAQSERFKEGDIAAVVPAPGVEFVPIRSAPQLNSDILTHIGPQARVTILDGQGVRGDQTIWWNIEHLASGIRGWLPDEVLSDPKHSAAMELQGSPTAEGTPTAIDGLDGCWPADAELEPVDGAQQWSEPPAMVIDPAMSYYATIVTGEGDILIELLVDEAPVAVNNFVCLASAGFYDGTTFHRLFEEHFIQGGDPTGTGEGGPGYTFEETLPDGYAAGDVAMANNAPDANGSQFFIALTDLSDEIPHDYPVFGRVTAGLDVAESISQGEVEPDIRGEQSKAVDPVTITAITIQELAPRIGPPEPSRDVDTGAPQPDEAEDEIVITANDIFFEPDEIRIPSDSDVVITLVNDGAVEHNFSVDELGISRTVAPGGEQQVIINAPAGVYEFFCNMPGHREAGMVGTLIVGDGQATAATPVPSEAEDGGDTEEQDGIVVVARDIFFEPDELMAAPLKPQVVTIVNEGAAPHNFSIDELNIDVDVAPGETATALLIAPSGEYEFYCNVPGHREAGMVGTLIAGDASAATDEDDRDGIGASACEGFEQYQTAYDDAIVTAIFSHPEAMPLLLEIEDLDFEKADELLTPEEWLILAEVFDSIGSELESVEPPAFAAAWHQNQVDALALLGDTLRAASDGGFVLAALTYGSEFMRVEAEFDMTLEEGSAICPEFRAWALEEGLDLGDEQPT